LKNSMDGMNEILDSVNESKMPAGRDLDVAGSPAKTVGWFELVGPSIKNLPPGTIAGQVSCQRKTGPPAPAAWQQHLDYALPNLDSDPPDDVVRERIGVKNERLSKGPLQAILEKRAEELE
jgi:hypothetical protein